jgi:DNA-binding NarL/FixJ family response regulator
MAQSIEEKTLDRIDQILRMLVVIATKGLKRRDQIALLDQAGFAPKQIADVLGTSANTVRVELVGLRKSQRAGKGRNGRSAPTPRAAE